MTETNFEFQGKKIVDIDALNSFLNKVREENAGTYVNVSNVVTNSDVDTIFDNNGAGGNTGPDFNGYIHAKFDFTEEMFDEYEIALYSEPTNWTEYIFRCGMPAESVEDIWVEDLNTGELNNVTGQVSDYDHITGGQWKTYRYMAKGGHTYNVYYKLNYQRFMDSEYRGWYSSVIAGSDQWFKVFDDPEYSDLSSAEPPHYPEYIFQGLFSGMKYYNIEVKIPEGVKWLGRELFRCSGLRNVILPSSLQRIGMRTFSYCTDLHSIEIPEGVTIIEDGAFEDCSNLATVVCKAMTAPTLGANVFGTYYNSFYSGGTLIVPTGATGYDAWMTKLGSGWTLQYSDDL